LVHTKNHLRLGDRAQLPLRRHRSRGRQALLLLGLRPRSRLAARPPRDRFLLHPGGRPRQDRPRRERTRV